MNKRIIPCLDIKQGKIVKGVKFEGLVEVADPLDQAIYYNDSSADELVFYDITASMEKRGFDAELFKSLVTNTSLPWTVGGAIATIEDIERALTYGASKVSINTGAIKDRNFIYNAAKRFGSERIMLAIDAKINDGNYYIYINGGRTNSSIDAIEWVVKGEGDGASEVVVNSIDADGVKKGYDITMLEAILKRVKIPIVASGGAGSKEDFLNLFKELPEIDAALAASVFHYRQINIKELKQYLLDNGISVHM